MLCSACQSIFRGPSIFQDGNGEHRRHHLTAENLAQAIRQNCYICTSLLEEYQDDKASTLDLPRLAEGFVGTKYGSSDSSNRYRCLRFALYSDWVDLNRSSIRYDEHGITMRPFVQLKSAPALIGLWSQMYLRRDADLHPTPHQSRVGTWPNNGYRLVLPIT